MNRYYQQGMSTLLITSMLLVVALIFSLASYKNLFYQIKRTQNEVLARQAHWAAEGGLECGFAKVQKVGSISDARASFPDCEHELDLADVDINSDNIIVSYYNKLAVKKIEKEIFLLPESYGAIQSRSDLKFLGDVKIAPDVIEHISGNNYRCISIKYSSKVESLDRLKILKPGEGHYNVTFSYPNVSSSAICNNEYNTDASNFDTNITPPSSNGPVKKDFEYDPFFDPFEGFFNKKRSEIASIKSEFKVINGSIDSITSDNRCAEKINKAFAISNKVWVKGDCDLHGDLIGSNPTIINQAKVLVFENGIVGTVGSTTFNGSVYHLIDEPDFYNVSLIPRWEAMSSSSFYAHLLDTNSVFFSFGSFVPTGGIIFDTPKGVTTYSSSLNLTYNRNFNPYVPKYKPNWKKGSWHDF
ncbi:TPA: hypothetical protein ACX6QK_002678 [Photobacterium damselae]